MTAQTTLTCTRCSRPIDDMADGYLVASEDGLQFTDAPDPKLESGEEPMHFVCPR